MLTLAHTQSCCSWLLPCDRIHPHFDFTCSFVNVASAILSQYKVFSWQQTHYSSLIEPPTSNKYPYPNKNLESNQVHKVNHITKAKTPNRHRTKQDVSATRYPNRRRDVQLFLLWPLEQHSRTPAVALSFVAVWAKVPTVPNPACGGYVARAPGFLRPLRAFDVGQRVGLRMHYEWRWYDAWVAAA
jgi:hypothetical protein